MLNLKGTTFPLVLAGATVPTFTVNKGLTGNGSTGYASTGINPSTATGLQFVQDSAHVGVYVLTDSANTNYDIGSGNSRARIKSAATTGTVARIGTNATNITATTGSSAAPRNVLASRTGAAASALYVNGASDTTSTGASNGLATGIQIFQDGGTAYSDRQIAVASIGAGLSATEAQAKHNAEKTYLQALGAVA